MNLDELKTMLEQIPKMKQVTLGNPVDMIDGNTLMNVILIFETGKPPDLNIHVRDTIETEDHYGGVK